MSLFSELKRRNVIRVAIAYLAAAWLLTEVSNTLFEIFDVGDAASQIVVILLAIGFPLFLVFSWVFELTPEGLRLEKDIRREESITAKTGKTLDRAIIVLLVLAVGYFAVDKFVFEPARVAEIVEETVQQARSDALVESYGDQSIAVLPFVNMSADPEQEYFSDGISEELLNLLAQIPELRVISRSSSFSFKGKDISIPQVAAELNVAHVLEGSVRKAGSRVRITAQLIEARSDTHLWSATYDRELDDIFAVQDEIAAIIGDSLRTELVQADGELASPTSIKTASFGAYEAFLRGREFLHLREQENIEQAISLLEHSVKLDDGFAPAHALLANATMLQSAYARVDWETAMRAASLHLERAQAIEPDLAEAHAGRALLALNYGDVESTIEHARKALRANPNYTDAMNWLYIGLNRLGRYEEAETTIERTVATDPLSMPGRVNYADLLTRAGRFEEAIVQADRLLSYSPGRGSVAHAFISYYKGDIAEALTWTLKAWALDTRHLQISVGWPLGFTWIGEYSEARHIQEQFTNWVEFADGNPDRAIQITRENLQKWPEGEAVFLAHLADFLYLAGRFEEALPAYEHFFTVVTERQTFPWESHVFACLAEFDMRLASTRRILGDEEGALAAAKTARQEQSTLRSDWTHTSWLHRVDAMIAAFDQKPDAVVKALEQAIRNGHRNPMFFDDPIFDDMRADSGFIAVQQELDAILEDERNQILQIICFDNPVPDDWHPMPETCEGVEEQHAP